MDAFQHLRRKVRSCSRSCTGATVRVETVFDNLDDFDTWDRCITRGMPVSMLTRNYNVGIRVMQLPGYVTILLEMAHEARIIPTDERPNLDPTIRQYLGESRGRWEGNTLVIETTELQRQTGNDQLSAFPVRRH